MENNCSTVTFRSNLYPVADTCLHDKQFLAKIHDPFSLEILKKSCKLTQLQEQEYRQASLHCSYADPGDYPWGTVNYADGSEQVVCRCLNTSCKHFARCRPDFDQAELNIHEINKKAVPAVFRPEEEEYKAAMDDGDAGAAAKLFEDDKPKADIAKADLPAKTPKAASPYIVSSQPKTPEAEAKPTQARKIDFDAFVEAAQKTVIEAEPDERIIVNAAPGTGKTWALTEKIICMISEEKAAPENILVLCSSRSAVEAIGSCLADAAGAGRVGSEYQKVDIRTLDSFSTYVLVWFHANYPEQLDPQFVLETCDYDQRVRKIASLFKEKKDILAGYEHIIIDDIQDLVSSRAELALTIFQALPDTCGFTVLGDVCEALSEHTADDVSSDMSSEQLYKEIFGYFPDASYYYMTENHRQIEMLENLASPYRKAILNGTAKERTAAAGALLANIPQMNKKLSQFDESDAMQYISRGTLGILTRTNGQALQASAWLRTAGIDHSLLQETGSNTLGGWISTIFCEYDGETIDEAEFISRYTELYPADGYEKAQRRWMALVSTQQYEWNEYEVSELLKGLLRNANAPELYECAFDADYAITVGDVNSTRGMEFDSVIVFDDVIEPMTEPGTENMPGHKVCYVALTRAKNSIERAEISKRDKDIYITKNSTQSKRCYKASLRGKKQISHFEVGNDADLDTKAFAAEEKMQSMLRHSVQPGMRLKLIRCAEGTNTYVTYRIVPEDNENIILGYTSETFAQELEKAIKQIQNTDGSIPFKAFPHAFCDVYVSKLVTYVSGISPAPAYAKVFDDICIWTGMTIAGFAAVDKDTY